MNLEGSLILCPFIKIVIGSPLELISSMTVRFFFLPDLFDQLFLSFCAADLQTDQKADGCSITFMSLFHLWAYLSILVITVVYNAHSWVKLMMTFPPTYSTFQYCESQQQEESFLVSTNLVSSCFAIKMCCNFNNSILSSSGGHPRAKTITYIFLLSLWHSHDLQLELRYPTLHTAILLVSYVFREEYYLLCRPVIYLYKCIYKFKKPMK